MARNQENTIRSVQLETTSRCDLTCVTCLKAEYRDRWLERDMSRQLWDRLLPQLKELKPAVHLQGWGEPLCHPQTLPYVNELKEEGLSVSFTTTGTRLERSTAESLIDSGLDGLTFSMAGISAAVQDPLRGAGTSAAVKQAIRTVAAARKSRCSTLPSLAVSYLLTPETVRELPAAVSWCRKNGVDTFVTVHLTQAGGCKQQGLQYLKSGQEPRSDRFLRMNTYARALFSRMRVELKPFHSTLTPVCDKNPLNSLFISAQGDVSPCVFLCPPVNQGIDWRRNGVKVHQEPLIFGNIGQACLNEIWRSQVYSAFRTQFRERTDYHDRKLARVSYSLSGCSELENAVRAIESYFSVHPAPEQCLGCAKLDGY